MRPLRAENSTDDSIMVRVFEKNFLVILVISPLVTWVKAPESPKMVVWCAEESHNRITFKKLKRT